MSVGSHKPVNGSAITARGAFEIVANSPCGFLRKCISTPMAAILARKSLSALRSRQLVLVGQAWQGTNTPNGTLIGTRSFATKHSFSTDKGLCCALQSPIRIHHPLP